MRLNYWTILVMIIFSPEASGQININSPYSRYGVGRQVFGGNGQNTGLGGTAIGFRAQNAINSINPASYTAQDTLSFILNIGMVCNYNMLKTSDLEDERLKSYFNDFSIGF